MHSSSGCATLGDGYFIACGRTHRCQYRTRRPYPHHTECVDIHQVAHPRVRSSRRCFCAATSRSFANAKEGDAGNHTPWRFYHKGKQGFAQAHWHGEPQQFTELRSRCALLVRENPLATTRLATVTHLSGLDIDSRSEKANKPPKTSQPASLQMITPAAVL